MPRSSINLRTPYRLRMALLIGAPLAASMPFLLNWLPTRLEASRLRDSVHSLRAQIAAREMQCRTMQSNIELVQAGMERLRPGEAERWLSQRAGRSIFNRCAEAITGSPVTVKRIDFAEPCWYAGASRDNFLAADRVRAVYSGDYDDVTRCLDELDKLPLPMRFTELTWRRQGPTQELTLTIDAPFVPGETLATLIADQAGLK